MMQTTLQTYEYKDADPELVEQITNIDRIMRGPFSEMTKKSLNEERNRLLEEIERRKKVNKKIERKKGRKNRN